MSESLTLTPEVERYAGWIEDLVDEGLSRAKAEATVAEWLADRGKADRIDAVLTWGQSPAGQVAERVDGDVVLLIIRGLRAVGNALRRDPVKVEARKAKRAERKAARKARRRQL